MKRQNLTLDERINRVCQDLKVMCDCATDYEFNLRVYNDTMAIIDEMETLLREETDNARVK